ncbi:hypothetical protein LPC08_10075 [Roseomonas sp. OT10]|uniref:hypothetical protein n=1 Tax=Roseomonas cutis TaxID=2897332 RepID=UPI001E3DEF73|nr:hypothetical protein [Roseomonas sp. OT10]UFN50924.1 hypothetical protein LPC08_10075 [Roseomonas sp. OT10]
MTDILIATPTAGGTVRAAYAFTLVHVVTALKNAGHRVQYVGLDGSSPAVARNHFANLFLRQPGFSHLLMIDSDMAFDGALVLRMLGMGKPFVAASYPKRALDLDAFAAAARSDPRPAAMLAGLVAEQTLQLDPGETSVTDGVCRARWVGCGCMLLHREVLERLVASGLAPVRPDRRLAALGLEGPVHDFFGELSLPDGDRLSEDYSFCERWNGLPGAEIWAILDAPIAHVGEMAYRGSLMARLRPTG